MASTHKWKKGDLYLVGKNKCIYVHRNENKKVGECAQLGKVQQTRIVGTNQSKKSDTSAQGLEERGTSAPRSNE